MTMIFRLGMWLAFAMFVTLAAEPQFAIAQRVKIGGFDQSNDNNRDGDDEDDDEERGDQDRPRSSRSRSSNSQQIQDFLQRRQQSKNQNNQGESDQIRRRPGQFPDQPFGQKPFPGQPQEIRQGGLKVGVWQGDRWQGSRNIDKWSQAFGNGQKPFSSQWYQNHPKAWKYDNNKANVWVTSSLPGVYGWLGWGNVPPQYNVGQGNVPQFDHTHYGDWYPLGVFSLMSGQGDPGTRVVQLVIDRHGHIAGNYYDMITDTNSSISGEVRRQSQRAEWTLNKNNFVRFRASINRLLQPYGYLTVQLPGGEQEWQFVRLEN